MSNFPSLLMSTILTTERLILREFLLTDADFLLGLLNSDTWLSYIGDRGARTVDDAVNYIKNGPIMSYNTWGYGPWLIALADTGAPIGLCGLIRRSGLDDADIGFALLPAYEGKGYAYEAAQATLAYAKEQLGLTSILAITTTDNIHSIKLLKKLGLHFQKIVTLPNDTTELLLYGKTEL